MVASLQRTCNANRSFLVLRMEVYDELRLLEHNDDNDDELLFELDDDNQETHVARHQHAVQLAQDEFDNTLNLFDKLLNAANDIRCACLPKTVRDVQGKPANGRGEVFYPRGMVRVG